MAELSLNAIAEALTATGYDVIDSTDDTGVVTARRDAEDGKAWEVVVDRGGQLKVTITYQARRPTAKSIGVLRRRMSILNERTATITAMFVLKDSTELPAVLTVIEETI